MSLYGWSRHLCWFRLEGEEQQHAVAADPDKVADEVANLVQMCVSRSL